MRSLGLAGSNRRTASGCFVASDDEVGVYGIRRFAGASSAEPFQGRWLPTWQEAFSSREISMCPVRIFPNRCNRFDRQPTARNACQAKNCRSRIIDLLAFKTFTCGNCASLRGDRSVVFVSVPVRNLRWLQSVLPEMIQT